MEGGLCFFWLVCCVVQVDNNNNILFLNFSHPHFSTLSHPLPYTYRLIIVGSITGNNNTLAGKIPPQADLADLAGLNAMVNGVQTPTINGDSDYWGAKAYKDTKVCGCTCVVSNGEVFV